MRPDHASVTLGLDPESRRVARGMLFWLGLLAVLAYGPWLGLARTLADSHALMSLACALGGLWAWRRYRGDPVGRGSLHAWDDALAFVAMARLAHMAGG